MGKQRKSKRQLIRDEKRAKKRDRELAEEEDSRESKRQRREEDDQVQKAEGDSVPLDDATRSRHEPDREFFGMLADEEQEYFRRADELLELNDFPTTEDRDMFLDNVYKEARGKELKLASSQSCSRLMERLILLSNIRQKKLLFEAFATHFVTLVTHRFASHCCEKLFIQSSPVVTKELGGFQEDSGGGGKEGEDEPEEKVQATMEELFMLTLDELEGHLSYLVSDRFGSHTLRVLLVVLSGRPLDQVSTKSLVQSKKKEHIHVPGVPAEAHEAASQLRAVPASFTLAIQKIITDITSSTDDTALRVLATHPTGNPVLQLLLELDISLNAKNKEKEEQLLLLKLLPGAPSSLNDAASPASEFVNSMMYDPIGSRLLETIITHAPGRVFKGLHANFFGPRISTYVRNDISSYPAIKALNRMSKEDLAAAVQKIIPEVPRLVEKGRLNVLKALFDRCNVRQVTAEVDALLEALVAACGSDETSLVPKLCFPEPEAEGQKKEPQFAKNTSAVASHGCQLVSTLLNAAGSPALAAQASLLSLDGAQILQLSTSSAPTLSVITTALATPSQRPGFHKGLVSLLMPHVKELGLSQFGHNVLNAIVSMPSRGADRQVPFHLKEALVTSLAGCEKELRDTWTGRSVWRTWKGDLWKHRRSDWIKWAKEADPVPLREDSASKPWNTAQVGKPKGKTFSAQKKVKSVGMAA